ncbi:MAG: DUF1934 domain-containing protein [Oscillospiraceae bacterium]|nr:DUF1934 domain-containing protein [Oscillospiraceae bacterium]
MKQPVMLTLRGQQNYPDQEPEVIELVTEGTLECVSGVWHISYEESDLTGMQGVTTHFAVEPGKIVLTRKGALNSQMVFQEGVYHDSLYQMEFGALLITVCAQKLAFSLTEAGGTVDLTYSIEIENTVAGSIDYHLELKGKK